MNVLISIYTDMLLSLSQGNYRGNISLSKPIFILSILESINKGDIKDNEITLNNIDLTNIFAGLYNHYNGNINGLKSSSFLNPFFHLATSDFYHLIWKEGVKQPPMSSTPLVSIFVKTFFMQNLMMNYGICYKMLKIENS